MNCLGLHCFFLLLLFFNMTQCPHGLHGFSQESPTQITVSTILWISLFCDHFVHVVHWLVKQAVKFSSFVFVCAHAGFVMASCQCFVSRCSWVCCVRGAGRGLLVVTICPLLTPLSRVGIDLTLSQFI